VRINLSEYISRKENLYDLPITKTYTGSVVYFWLEMHHESRRPSQASNRLSTQVPVNPYCLSENYKNSKIDKLESGLYYKS
jgi:hypothetical protein